MAKKRGRKKPGPRLPPKCKAILLCQSPLLEAGTNNLSLVRIFDNFNQTSFPSATWPFVVFMQLVGGIGSYQTVIEIHDLQDGEVIARAEGIVEFADRVRAQNLLIPVPPLLLQHPGPYDVVLLADGLEIDRQRFTATLIGGTNDGDNEPEPDEEGER